MSAGPRGRKPLTAMRCHCRRRPQRYEFSIRREWHGYTATPARPVVLRLPLPLRAGPARACPRQARGTWQRGRGDPRDAGSGGKSGSIRRKGTVRSWRSCRWSSWPAKRVIRCCLHQRLVPQSRRKSRSGCATARGLVVMSPAVTKLAAELARGCGDAREYLHAIWRWLISELLFGDWHRTDMESRTLWDG